MKSQKQSKRIVVTGRERPEPVKVKVVKTRGAQKKRSGADLLRQGLADKTFM